MSKAHVFESLEEVYQMLQKKISCDLLLDSRAHVSLFCLKAIDLKLKQQKTATFILAALT